MCQNKGQWYSRISQIFKLISAICFGYYPEHVFVLRGAERDVPVFSARLQMTMMNNNPNYAKQIQDNLEHSLRLGFSCAMGRYLR